MSKICKHETARVTCDACGIDFPGCHVVNEWKQAIENALISACLGTADSFPNAETALDALICWSEEVALDPLVSKQAQTLIDRGRAEAKSDPSDTSARPRPTDGGRESC